MKKKVVSMLLSSAMVLGLVACSGSTSTESGTTGTQASGDSVVTNSDGSGASERQTITWSVIDVNAGVNATGEYADQIIQQIEDYCGADIDLIWYANDALSEKNSLALTSPSTMPQIMSWGGTVTGDVVSAAKNGAFVDLNNFPSDLRAMTQSSKKLTLRDDST